MAHPYKQKKSEPLIACLAKYLCEATLAYRETRTTRMKKKYIPACKMFLRNQFTLALRTQMQDASSVPIA